jgi:putative hydrolase of the HAD superfamily
MEAKMLVRAIVFDLFDTLLYFDMSDARKEEIRLVKKAGLSEAAWFTGWRTTLADAHCGRIGDLEEHVRQALIAAGMEKPSESLVVNIAAARMLQIIDAPRLYSDTKECLSYLRTQGFQLALVSNIFAYEAQSLDRFGLRPFFDAVVLSCETGIVKPDPKIYRLAMERLGVEPNECVFVGDGANNELTAAQKLGMTTVKIARATRDDNYGGNEPCDAEVADLQGLIIWLEAQQG